MSNINYDISWEINSPSVTYGHRKSVFKSVFLFNCVHSNFSEILGPWEQINGEKTKQNKSTSIKYDVISLSQPVSINVVLAGN